MNLYYNGCSLTYGDELTDPKNSAWPAVLSSQLKSNFYNDAVSGGTNDRIVYNIFKNIEQYDYFFIAWTSYSRFTEYNPVDNYEINFTPQLGMDPASHASNDLKKNYQKYKIYGELYYKHWFNELYEFKKWLQQIILLQSFFKIHNKKYLMLNSFSNNLAEWLQPRETFIQSTRHMIDFFDYINDSCLLDEHNQIQELTSLIDKSTFVEWNHWYISDLGRKFPRGPGGHILEAGHQEVAKKVLEHYICSN